MSKYVCFMVGGATYVGEPPLSLNETALIRKVRKLQELQIPTPQGIASTTQMISCGVARSGVDMRINMHITPYWLPDKEEERVLDMLVEGCEKNEQQQRAKDSGLMLATSMPPRR